jgi:hypothetical protein
MFGSSANIYGVKAGLAAARQDTAFERLIDMARALSQGAAITLRLDTIEHTAKSLTRTQIHGLIRIRDRGPLAWCHGLGRAGGAVSRMFERMVAQGLCTRAPHEITSFGRAVLKARRY